MALPPESLHARRAIVNRDACEMCVRKCVVWQGHWKWRGGAPATRCCAGEIATLRAPTTASTRAGARLRAPSAATKWNISTHTASQRTRLPDWAIDRAKPEGREGHTRSAFDDIGESGTTGVRGRLGDLGDAGSAWPWAGSGRARGLGGVMRAGSDGCANSGLVTLPCAAAAV